MLRMSVNITYVIPIIILLDLTYKYIVLLFACLLLYC